MPIRPEWRKRWYGAAWRDYRRALIAQHGARCSACGRDVAPYFNLAHLTPDPRNSDVALMCICCHNRHDAAHRLAIWRRTRAKRYGQLWLWPEVEFAPYPLWAVPRRVSAAAQERMF